MANTAGESAFPNDAHPAYSAHDISRSEVSSARTQTDLAGADLAPQQDVRVLRIPVGTRLADAERWMIFATLGRCGGNKTRAAALLGVSLKTLYNRLNAYRAHGLAMDYEAQDYELIGDDVVDRGADAAAIRSEFT